MRSTGGAVSLAERLDEQVAAAEWLLRRDREIRGGVGIGSTS
jgi:hypothetical protein